MILLQHRSIWLSVIAIALGERSVYSFSSQQHPFEVEQTHSTVGKHLYGRFLHFTDLHPDQYYTPGASVNDACHIISDSSNATSHEDLGATKKGKKINKRVGHYGAPVSVCDSPRALIESSLEWLSDNWMTSNESISSEEKDGKGIDYIIWTGDTARHDIDATHPRNAAEIFDYNRWVLDLVEKRFPGIPIVPNLGNNDIIPHNIMFPGPNLMTRSYADIWRDHIPIQQYETFQKGGYYSKEIIEGDLAVVSLNTLYWFNNNAAVRGCKGRNDPGTIHLNWLEKSLETYRNRKMQVQLIGHVPPTSNNFFDNCYERYTDMALRYQDTIVGQHFGHMNIDAWYLQKDPDAKRSKLRTISEEDADQHMPFYTAPSIVPTYLPAVRVWTYNTTKAIQLRQEDNQQMQMNKKKKHRKLPHHVSLHSPSRSNTYLSLLGYSQWILDLDKANRRYRKESNMSIPHSKLNYQLQYTTYSPNVLWSEYSDDNNDESNDNSPVPKHLLDIELRRLKVGSPIEQNITQHMNKSSTTLKVHRKLRHLTKYSLPSFTIKEMLAWADSMISCKKLKRKNKKRKKNREGFCRMKGGGHLYRTSQDD